MKRQGPAGTEKSWRPLFARSRTGASSTSIATLADRSPHLYCKCSTCIWGCAGKGSWLGFPLLFTGDSTVSQLLRGDNERLVCGSGCASAEWWWPALVLWWQQLHHIHEGGGGQVSDEAGCLRINSFSYYSLAPGIFPGVVCFCFWGIFIFSIKNNKKVLYT